jgi:hypothetical protein
MTAEIDERFPRGKIAQMVWPSASRPDAFTGRNARKASACSAVFRSSRV